jgi:hypothetical protein
MHLPTHEVLACPRKQLGDIENWGSELSFANQLGALRKSLVGEFDTLDQSVALRLAQLYLYFAMGAEAIATVDALGQTGREVDFLRPLAALLDGESPDNLSTDIPTVGCKGSHAIWGALLNTTNDSITESQAKVIVQSLEALPHHLRSILGPKLITRLKHDGNEIAASVIRNLIANFHDDGSKEPLSPEDFKDLSIEELNELIQRNTTKTPQALLALFEAKIKQGSAASDSIREVAKSFVVQQHRDPISVKLQTVLAKDAALGGAYLDAVQAAFSLENLADISEVVSFSARRLVDFGSDTDVAKFALRLGPALGNKHLKSKTISAIAERLRKAGMSDLANTFSGNEPDPHATATTNSEVTNSIEIITPTSNKPSDARLPTLASAQTTLDSSRATREQIMSMLNPP